MREGAAQTRDFLLRLTPTDHDVPVLLPRGFHGRGDLRSFVPGALRLLGERRGDGVDDAVGDVGGGTYVVGLELAGGEVAVLGEGTVAADVVGFREGVRRNDAGEP